MYADLNIPQNFISETRHKFGKRVSDCHYLVERLYCVYQPSDMINSDRVISSSDKYGSSAILPPVCTTKKVSTDVIISKLATLGD